MAYRDLIFIMFALFAVLTLLMVPAMMFYKSYNGITGTSVGYSKLSLGNLGYSSTQCQIVPLDLGKVTMFCPYGTVADIKYLGINPSTMKERDICRNTQDNGNCSSLVNPGFKEVLDKEV